MGPEYQSRPAQEVVLGQGLVQEKSGRERPAGHAAAMDLEGWEDCLAPLF